MYDGQIIPDHGPMTSSSNYLCQTLSSVARQIVGRPIFPTENGRAGLRLIGIGSKYLGTKREQKKTPTVPDLILKIKVQRTFVHFFTNIVYPFFITLQYCLCHIHA